jgi:DNA repair exonuclease SbcCD ATPase subunit
LNTLRGGKKYNDYQSDLEKENSIKAITQEIFSLNRDLGSLEKQLELLENNLIQEQKLLKQRNDTSKEIKYADFLSRTFGKKGAPVLIMQNGLSSINKIANEICLLYNVPFKFNLTFIQDDTEDAIGGLNIFITDINDKTRHVSSYSGGEIQLIQLILRFAIQEYISTILRTQTSDVFLCDEAWSEMDSNLAEMAYNIIISKRLFSQIIIITHDTSFCSRFENVVEFLKNGATSTAEMVNG